MARRRGDPEVLQFLTELLIARYAPADARSRALDRFATNLVPSLRTIASMAADLRVPSGKRWSASGADPADAALILPVLGTIATNSDDRISSMTTTTAEWVARVARMAPGLLPHRIYQYAIRYQLGPDPALDLELARETAKPPRRG